MSFIFRTIFWLSLAIVVVPPQARVGGQDTADFKDVDLEHELRTATFSLWSWAADASSACGTNPQLCAAASDLWDTVWSTAAKIATEGQNLEANQDLETFALAANADEDEEE